MANRLAVVELDAQLRRLVAGEITWHAVQHSWKGVFCGNVEFRTSDGWTIVVFNDCDEFDYVDRAEAPDGRAITFDEMWVAHEDEPLRVMVDHLHDLEQLAEQAEVRYG